MRQPRLNLHQPSLLDSPQAESYRSRHAVGKTVKASQTLLNEYLQEKLEPPPPVITEDAENGEKILQEGRTVNYLAPITTGLAVGLNIFMVSGFVTKLITEFLVDGGYLRLVMLAITPLFVIISQFLWDNFVSFFAQIFFPIKHMHENSLYYSGQASEPLPGDYSLPSFTIHMPCYKEGLHSVLAPSLESALAAVKVSVTMGLR
jgi:hypothetical protein